jgi:hypothetical protein
VVRDRASWLDDDGELQVFVPGLMATGILVSIGMFIWDGVRKFMPDLGARKRAARLSMQTNGRVNDLVSIERGLPPAPVRIQRVRRTRGSALLLAVLAWTAALSIGFATLTAFTSEGTSFSGRGWTLSMGMSVMFTCGAFGIAWLYSALVKQGPQWVTKAQTRWPIGMLPEIDERDL